MNRFLPAAMVVAVLALVGYYVATSATADSMMAMGPGPTSGFTLHIDADKHFGAAHPDEIAHHWCKTINPSLTECQLYDGDGPHARLVGVETIVPTAVWKTFAPAEQALWHYHKTELKKIHATLPGMPKAQAAKVVAQISETYGKVWILWDPLTTANPIGQPSITVLK